MKVELMGSTATQGAAAMSVCSAIDAFGKAPNIAPLIRPGFADQLMVS